MDDTDGVWGRDITQQAASTTAGHAWWLKFVTLCKELSYVAQRVLAQVSSACTCERNWSAYDFVHGERRNRLLPERAEKLVYVFSNPRLAASAGAVDGGDAKFMPRGSPVMFQSTKSGIIHLWNIPLLHYSNIPLMESYQLCGRGSSAGYFTSTALTYKIPL
jgi:hAT family C-terminal dimerisation region